jgi:hypothetical protein
MQRGAHRTVDVVVVAVAVGGRRQRDLPRNLRRARAPPS